MKVNRNRVSVGVSISIVGAGILAFGVLLALVKLLVHLAWHYAGAIVLAGLILLLAGMIIQKT